MATLVDEKFRALRALGYTGTISDMTLQWLKAGGATSDSIPDAWFEFLLANLIGATAESYHRNDDWYEYLAQEGFATGSLNDRETDFWKSLGILDQVVFINDDLAVFRNNDPVEYR